MENLERYQLLERAKKDLTRVAESIESPSHRCNECGLTVQDNFENHNRKKELEATINKVEKLANYYLVRIEEESRATFSK